MSIVASIKKGISKVVLRLDKGGKLKAIVDRDKLETSEFIEEIGITIKSLMTGVELFHTNGIDTLTPKAMLFISRLDKGDWATRTLKEQYDKIRAEMIEILLPKNGEDKSERIVSKIEDSWKMLLSKKDRFIYMGQLYKTMFLPTFTEKNRVYIIPMFDSFIVDNAMKYMSYNVGAIGNESRRTEWRKSADDELNKIKYTARQFLSSNKLHAFIDDMFKADFNVLAPFTHGAYKTSEILVPQSSGFAIGSRLAGMRHPVMTGVVIFTVAGYTPDNTIKVDEVHFKRFQADSDGDFFLVSDLLYYLMSGKK